MHTYGTVVHLAIQEFLAYRLNFILWRVRNILNLMLIYFLWTNVFAVEQELFGYTETQIVSYILITNVLGALVFSTKTSEVADQILTGKIIDPLLKPFNYFGYIGGREFADKMLNLCFSIGEISLILLLLRPEIEVQLSVMTILSIGVFLVNGICISFFISLLLSLFAFWSTDVWGPKFIYFVLTSLLAGIMFPLDVLPEPLYSLILFTPFPYLVYIPAKIAVFGASSEFIPLIVMSTFWIVLLFVVTRFVWHKGMKEFSFFGK
jgi:ABC-2 type transport system permease protein